jgi:excisionase family DNA binding protein
VNVFNPGDNMKTYTVKQVAKILHLNEEVVRRKLKSGEIKAFKIGRLWRISEKSLKEIIENENK